MKRGIYIVFLFLLLVAVAALYLHHNESKYNDAINGVIQLSNVDFEKNDKAYLDGQWELYYDKLLTPSEIVKEKISPDGYMLVPGEWKHKDSSNIELATLRVKVVLDKKYSSLALKLPVIGCSYRVWCDNQLIANVGNIDVEKQSVQVEKHPAKTAVFVQPSEEFFITINIGNIKDVSYSGVRHSIEIGSLESLMTKTNFLYNFESFIIGCIFIIGVYHVIFFLMIKENKSVLYYSIICFAIAARTFLSSDFCYHMLLPYLSRDIILKAFNVSSDVALIGAILFFGNIFEKENHEIISKIFIFFFSMFCILESIILSTHLATIVNIVNIFCILYIIIVILKAYRYKRKGSRIILYASIISFVFISLDILYALFDNFYIRVFEYYNFSTIGVFVYILFQAYMLAIDLLESYNMKEKLLEENNKINLELKKVNTNLESMVDERTQELEKTMKEIRKAYKKIEILSKKDPLTGISNRRDFLESVRKSYGHSNKSFAIVMIDIDNFKSINDVFGHNFGDRVLKRIATILANEVSICARWGGEEFIFCIDENARSSIYARIEQIRNAIKEETFYFKSQPIKITSTFGICEHGTWKDIYDCINKADEAMYYGKRNGKDKIVFYNDYTDVKIFHDRCDIDIR